MSRIKIDYGIDLGTTNSAISRMEKGEAVIIKSKDGNEKDTTPSCVSFNAKGHVNVGDAAFRRYRSDSNRSLSRNITLNSFVEFKRTMGTDKKYFASNIDRNLSSEELSAEVLKQLKQYVQDEIVNAAVITVPAAFKNNQIDATRRAAVLAGFSHVEVLQEPVAAALAYGFDSKQKDGFWLVFDFGGGTFDAALLKVEEGIMKVSDTEGDNYLGGKNLDLAIVDQVIMPYIEENYVMDSFLSNDQKKRVLRNAMKFYAEEAKNILSSNDVCNLYIDPGDIGEDDDGEEIEIDITLTQNDMERILSPIFQKAIDLCHNLLKRNNLNGSDLDSLVLVGGPTYSPILRKMLEEQITIAESSVDPMTVVSNGAALYASTIDISQEIQDQTRDRSKIQIEIGHKSTSVELFEYVTLKILADKTEGEIPKIVFAEVKRNDGAWVSDKIEINTIGDLIEVSLNEGKSNSFEVVLFDEKSNILESEPKEFMIIQGVDVTDMQGLTLNWGIEIKQKGTNKVIFQQLTGLEKNKPLPAIGIKNGLKTQKQIRNAIKSDYIKIPLYQGQYGADGTRAVYNDHVYDIIISGADLPALLPANSDVDLTIKVDKSQNVSVQAYFPYLDHTAEINVPTDTVQSVGTEWLKTEFEKAKGSIEELKQAGSSLDKVINIENEISSLEKQFHNNLNDEDNKQEVLTNLRKSLKDIDVIMLETEWPQLEEKLKKDFYRLEKVNNDLGNDRSTTLVNQYRNQLEEVIALEDIKLGNTLLGNIDSLFFKLTMIYQLIGMIENFNNNFNSYEWSDRDRARQLVNTGMNKIAHNPNTEELRQILIPLFNMLPKEQKPGVDDSVLVG